MVRTVTNHVQPTVGTIHITFNIDTVLGVSLDGQGQLATQVWLSFKFKGKLELFTLGCDVVIQ